jgi:hypothetical protein
MNGGAHARGRQAWQLNSKIEPLNQGVPKDATLLSYNFEDI